MLLKVLVSLLGVVCMWHECVCFPNGSVAFSCGSLMPVHPPYTPATSSPPFTVTTSSATYRPGGVITVTVEAVGNSTEFQGFMLQARSWEQQALLWPIGKFTNIDPTQFTALHCNSMENSTVAQATGAKKKRVQLTWEAPSTNNNRDIYFSATLIQNYAVFWINLNSSSVKADNNGSPAAGVFSPLVLLFINLLSLSAYC